jgi:acyl-CoA synthetase (AMP-forming)/AMP-acid ligase II
MPDAPAVVAGTSEVSYADLLALIVALNGRLRHHGVRPGDRVAILGLNSIEWVAAFLACLDTGAVAAPLSYRLSPHELEEQIALLKPRVVLADEEFLGVRGGRREARRLDLLPLTGLDTLRSRSGRGARRRDRRGVHPSHALISFTSGSTVRRRAP